jgi:DNA polymerase-3 subunit delta'
MARLVVKCLACNWFAQGNHPDFRLLQPDALTEDVEAKKGRKKPASKSRSIRCAALDEFLNVGTHADGLRVVLINPTEAMNRSTANAFLKHLKNHLQVHCF